MADAVQIDAVQITAIGQIAINVHDLDRATAFYRDTLGLQFLFQVPKMAFFACGGVRLMLALAEQPEFDHPASILYYRVSDLHAAHRALVAAGVDCESAPHLVHRSAEQELWLAFFRDPEHNLLALMSEVPSSPPE